MGIFIRKHVPMLRYAICLMAGICIASYIQISTYLLEVLIIGLIGFIFYRIRNPVGKYRMQLFVCIALMSCTIGVTRQCLWSESSEEESIQKIRTLRIVTVPAYNAYSIRFEAEELPVYAFDIFDRRRYIVSCADTAANLLYGDVLRVQAQPEAIEASPLPYSFDYAAYLFSRGIRKKITLCYAEKIPDKTALSWFYRWINKSRAQFKRSTSLVFTNASAKGLAESLLLGYKEELDASTKDAFQRSGVSHLLAVSGMHTALIYEMLFLLFLPFGTSQKHRFVFLFSALCVLFYFTILSGCSASVLRSSIMCSTFAIGYAFRRKGNGLNTLGTSIVIILCVSPYQLWDLGFHLSILAVFGILTLHAFVSKEFEHLHKVPKYLLNAVSITMCAQVTTLPVILYHFHSFPVYFIFANLLLIPISTFGMFLTMFSITIAGAGLHIPYLFDVTQWIIQVFERCAFFFAELPCSIIHPVSFSGIEYILCAAMIVCFLFLLPVKRVYLSAILLLCIVWSTYRIYQETVYATRTQTFFICNNKKSGLVVLKGFRADCYVQQLYSTMERKNIQDYYNLPHLKMHVIPSDNIGMIWHSDRKDYAWLYKGKQIDVQDFKNMEELSVFAYSLPDTSILKPNAFIPLNVKSIHSLK